ncbi:MAG: LD-carboxypeptidase [Paludibacteraceae bacterium]|nr:LD-carboxypeptidase [Paludibacteraceae bacterium]
MKEIRIISPAGALDASLIEQAAARLRSEGYSVSIAPHACGRYGRFAACAEERAADAVDALTDKNVGLVLCSRGGYGMQQIIDSIERGVLEHTYNGAPACGFSDITELHQLIARLGGASIHGIMCKPIATLPADAEPWQALLRMLRGEACVYETEPSPLNRTGETTGVLRGGNMAVLCGLSGTPYDIRLSIERDREEGKKTVLFIEEVGEPHYKIDRMMHQLRLSGVLEAVSGVIIGQFADCDDDPEMGCTLQESIASVLKDYDCPQLFGFPAGHVTHNMPLPFGMPVTLTVTKKAGRVTCSALPLGLEPRTP